MDDFDYDNATADELWDWCLLEYRSRNPITKYLLSRFFSRLNNILATLGPHDRVLEVGCGPGESSRTIGTMLPTQHFEVSEFDHRYVQKLHETDFPYKVIQESVYELQREDSSFDCVLLLEVLEHLENVPLALQELFRVSKRYVVISTPNEPLWRILNMVRGRYLRDWGNTPGHLNHWNARTLAQLVSGYGHVRRVYTPLPWTIVLAETR